MNRLYRLGLAQIVAWLVVVLPLLGVGVDYLRTDWKPQGQGVEGLSGLYGAVLLLVGIPLLGSALWVGRALLHGDGRLKPLAFALSLVLLAVGGIAALTVGIWVSAVFHQSPWSAVLAVGVAAFIVLTTIVNAGYVAFEVFAHPSP